MWSFGILLRRISEEVERGAADRKVQGTWLAGWPSKKKSRALRDPSSIPNVSVGKGPSKNGSVCGEKLKAAGKTRQKKSSRATLVCLTRLLVKSCAMHHLPSCLTSKIFRLPTSHSTRWTSFTPLHSNFSVLAFREKLMSSAGRRFLSESNPGGSTQAELMFHPTSLSAFSVCWSPSKRGG